MTIIRDTVAPTTCITKMYGLRHFTIRIAHATTVGTMEFANPVKPIYAYYNYDALYRQLGYLHGNIKCSNRVTVPAMSAMEYIITDGAARRAVHFLNRAS